MVIYRLDENGEYTGESRRILPFGRWDANETVIEPQPEDNHISKTEEENA